MRNGLTLLIIFLSFHSGSLCIADEYRPQPISLPTSASIPNIDSLNGFRNRYNRIGTAANFAYAGMHTVFSYGRDKTMQQSLEKLVVEQWDYVQSNGYEGVLLMAKAYETCDASGCRTQYASDRYLSIGGASHPVMALAKVITGDAPPGEDTLAVMSAFSRKPSSDHYVWIQEDSDGSIEVHKYSGNLIRDYAQKIASEKFLYNQTLIREKSEKTYNRLRYYSKTAKSERNRAYLKEIIAQRQKSLTKLNEISASLKEAQNEAYRSNQVASKFGTLSNILGIAAAIGQARQSMANKSQWDAIQANLDATGDRVAALENSMVLFDQTLKSNQTKIKQLTEKLANSQNTYNQFNTSVRVFINDPDFLIQIDKDGPVTMPGIE